MNPEPQSRTFNLRIVLRQPVGRLIRLSESMTESELAGLLTGLQTWTQGYIHGDTKAGNHIAIPVTNIAYVEAVPR